MFRCLGILREMQNSPNRETDDALILKAVLAQLETLGIAVRLMTPESVDRHDPSGWDLVLPMCEAYPRLKRLEGLVRDSRTLWVNEPRAVFNCYRLRMSELLANSPEVRFPPTQARRVSQGAGRGPTAAEAGPGWWIKRGDVHNTCDHDVVFARDRAAAGRILEDFARREITHYVVQPHVEGDLVKFYGVGPGRWFTWFYHDPVRAKRLPFTLDALAGMAAAGAKALGLEVFGGDAIISKGGAVTLLDINSWPSFAKVREEAAVQISWHLQSRLLARRGKPRNGAKRSK
ncbi:MAG: hypothetical protein AAB412_06310 [Elusimicrobiota bacterium]